MRFRRQQCAYVFGVDRRVHLPLHHHRPYGPADGFCPTGCGPTLDSTAMAAATGGSKPWVRLRRRPRSVTCTSISCDDGNACTADTTSGSAGTCNVACAHATIATCTNADGCCPAGCNATNDNDCGAVCGNGVREGGETCEVAPATPVCSAISCNDNNACTTDTKPGPTARATSRASTRGDRVRERRVLPGWRARRLHLAQRYN